MRKCVRCRVFPRKADEHGHAYVCDACSAEPSLQAEIDMALASDPANPRLWLIQHLGWAGGWPRKDASVHV